MQPILIHYDNGDSQATECNGTRAEIERYYIGQQVNFGDRGDGAHDADDLHRVVRVEFLTES